MLATIALGAAQSPVGKSLPQLHRTAVLLVLVTIPDCTDAWVTSSCVSSRIHTFKSVHLMPGPRHAEQTCMGV